MKKLFALLFLLAFFTNVMSQHHPVFEEGKCWSVDMTKWGEEVLYTSTFVVRGDSVVNGKRYKKVYVTHKDDLKDLELYYLGRDEKGVAYILEDEIEYCFFDFNLRAGDEFVYELGTRSSAADDCKWIVTDVSSIETADGLIRKCFDVEVYEYWSDAEEPGWYKAPYPFTYIEGIGEADNGLFVDYCISCTGGGIRKLRCLHNVYGNHIYGTGENCNKLSVDATKGEQENEGALYDLKGNKLNIRPQNGVYIQAGKKYLKKRGSSF